MTASNFVDVDPAPASPLRLGVEFARYFVCSAVALAADFGLFMLALRLGLGYAPAAAIGFVVGLWLAYTLSVRFVFSARAMADARVEFIIFAAIGIFGLLLTEALLWLLVGHCGLHPVLAKVLTSGAVFCTNFALRKGILFTADAVRVEA